MEFVFGAPHPGCTAAMKYRKWMLLNKIRLGTWLLYLKAKMLLAVSGCLLSRSIARLKARLVAKRKLWH